MSLIDKMRQRLFDVLDPNIKYTQEDFNNEFNQNSNINEIPKIIVVFTNSSKNKNPSYIKNKDSGFDIAADIENMLHTTTQNGEKIINLMPGERMLVSTGLSFNLPLNLELQIRTKSELAINNGIIVLDSPSTINNTFNKEIKILLYNTSKDSFIIKQGDYIATAVLFNALSDDVIQLKQNDK